MPLQDWIEKYPQVKRLLDQGEEALLDASSESQAGREEPDPEFEDAIRAIWGETILTQIQEVRHEVQAIQDAQEAHLMAMVEAFRIDCATGAGLEALERHVGIQRADVHVTVEQGGAPSQEQLDQMTQRAGPACALPTPTEKRVPGTIRVEVERG